MVLFCEISYEGSARIAAHLSNDEFHSNWCERSLIFMGVNALLYKRVL
jgi:hypothetical protein